MIFAVISAVYLGLLCSISPCPLATNIAAVSFIGRNAGKTSAVFYAGLWYALGRVWIFCLLGWLLAGMADAAPAMAHWLQKYMNMFLGPCMVLIGMVLLDLLPLPAWKGVPVSDRIVRITGKSRMLGALLLGIVFALSFCPSSVVLFFGTLIPLALEMKSPLLLSGIFGLASCVPSLIFAFVLAFCSGKLARGYQFTGKLEFWMQKLTGFVFLLVGIGLVCVQIFR